MSNWLKAFLKGGPGSGCHGDNCGRPAGHGPNTGGVHKPASSVPRYTEVNSSRNPGKPRSGIRPSDLYPERGKPKS